MLDPSRISLYIGPTGIDGATFKREQLMDKFGIQINKTSRNTVLFMTNIGTTRSAVAYLIEVLVTIARDLEDGAVEMSPAQQAAHARAVLNQTRAVRTTTGLRRISTRPSSASHLGTRLSRVMCSTRSLSPPTTARASTCSPTR